jgi:hypothetical protein
MTFRQAVQSSPAIAVHYQAGLRGVSSVDRRRMRGSVRRITGSLDLENALRPTQPNQPVWDYGIGIRHTANRDKAIWVEVHGANNLHVGEVLRKLTWLRAWLSREARNLQGISTDFVWLATGTVYLTPDMPQKRRLSQEGIVLRSGQLDLDSFR